MPSLLSRVKLYLTHLDTTAVAKNLTIPLSFILPISILYLLHPNSFQLTWKGRTLYLFFLWLFFLELLMGWEKLSKKNFCSLREKKTLAVAATMIAPTAYVIAVSMFGLSDVIVEIGRLLGLPPFGYAESFLTHHWPLSLEYLVFTALFTASIQLTHGINGLKRFLICLFFLGATGSFYMIDTFYPYTTLTALQSLVPFTASSAVRVLGWMGYGAELIFFPDGLVLMLVAGPHGGAAWYINWPCAGIHSLLIYTFVILLFIKDAPFSPQRKVIYASIPKKLKFMAKSKGTSSLFERKIIRTAITAAKTLFVNVLRMVPIYIIVVIGAVGTFIVNVLRIVSISIIGSKIGRDAGQLFHSNYGQLYFIVWITIYLLILLLLSRRIQPRLLIQGQASRSRVIAIWTKQKDVPTGDHACHSTNGLTAA